jgi:hypothetical protein
MTLGGHTGLAHFNKYFCLCHPNSGSYCYGNHILFYLTQMRGQSKDILFLQSLHFKSVKKCQTTKSLHILSNKILVVGAIYCMSD